MHQFDLYMLVKLQNSAHMHIESTLQLCLHVVGQLLPLPTVDTPTQLQRERANNPFSMHVVVCR